MPTFSTDDLLTLHEPNGHEFDVTLVSVSTESAQDGTAPDVRLLFDTGWDTYDREVEIFNLFHSSPEVRGDGPPDGFIPGKRVRVELRLSSALAREHFHGTDAETIARHLIALRDDDREHPLLETEAWYLTAASQSLPLPAEASPTAALREGYRTTWDTAASV
ncbi:MAG: hypothetical protein M0R73_13870 [Dehalococcoidia bacterium]|nr:hypothetical protein [Dehalococcoidia bacterium]